MGGESDSSFGRPSVTDQTPAMLCPRAQWSYFQSLVERLMHKTGVEEKLERWLKWSPRLRRCKECTDRWPCLRRILIVAYCSKGLIVFLALVLYGSLHKPHDASAPHDAVTRLHNESAHSHA